METEQRKMLVAYRWFVMRFPQGIELKNREIVSNIKMLLHFGHFILYIHFKHHIHKFCFFWRHEAWRQVRVIIKTISRIFLLVHVHTY